MQVVLSQRMMIDFPEKPINFYRELRQINPSPYMYYLNMGDYTAHTYSWFVRKYGQQKGEQEWYKNRNNTNYCILLLRIA